MKKNKKFCQVLNKLIHFYNKQFVYNNVISNSNTVYLNFIVNEYRRGNKRSWYEVYM